MTVLCYYCCRQTNQLFTQFTQEETKMPNKKIYYLFGGKCPECDGNLTKSHMYEKTGNKHSAVGSKYKCDDCKWRHTVDFSGKINTLNKKPISEKKMQAYLRQQSKKPHVGSSTDIKCHKVLKLKLGTFSFVL